MGLSPREQTLKALMIWAKTCFPWTYIYLPARGLLSLIRIDPEKTLWQIGESLRLRSYTKLPDGSTLLYRPLTWDHEAIKDVYGYEEYEQVFHIQKKDIIVDVGAHIGTFSLKAAQQVGNQGLVVAIEPEEENFTFLAANKKINRVKNIVLIHGALSDNSGTARLYSRSGHSGGFSIVEKHSSHYTQVPVFTLDNLATKLCLRQVDFLKIDAEGSELKVLKGGRRILQSSKAKIVVAAYHKSDNTQKISNFLHSLGYKTTCSKHKFIYGWK